MLVLLVTLLLVSLASATPCPAMDWLGPGSNDASNPTTLPYYVLPDPMSPKVPEVMCIVVGPENTGGAGRRGKWSGKGAGGFHEDRDIKPHLAMVPNFSRGHLIANNYFRDDADRRKTFATINMIPQQVRCNDGWWRTDVEDKVSFYMADRRHYGHQVFVGSFGNVGPPNGAPRPILQHREFMWTAVCVPARGFYFVASNPNTEGCAPRVLDGRKVKGDLSSVIDSLKRVCGPEVWMWLSLPAKAVPSTGSAYTRSGGGGGGETFPERRHDVGYSRSTHEDALRIARAKRQYFMGGGRHNTGY